jgi:hypothetical protein
MPVYDLGERRVEIRGPDVYIAPNAALIGSVIVGNECSFWFGAVVRGDNELSRSAIAPTTGRLRRARRSRHSSCDRRECLGRAHGDAARLHYRGR